MMSDPTLGIKIGRLCRASEQDPVRINFDTWIAYPRIKGAAGARARTISRHELPALVADTASSGFDRSTDTELEHLFVRTMMWGSGTSNGRGPRYTNEALCGGAVAPTLRDAYQLLAAGKVGYTYQLHRRIRCVGPAFFTKLLWVLGSAVDTSPQPLILDARVWNSLRAVGWSSLQAAGSRRWSQRYEAYLRACSGWATQAGGGHTSEDVEYTLFARNGNEPAHGERRDC